MTRRLLAWFGTVVAMVACGGGADDDARARRERAEIDFHAAAGIIVPAPRRTALASERQARAAAAAADVDAIDAATQLMDFAEATFPAYFPSRQFNRQQTPYLYRFYPESGIYLGVSAGKVYLVGGPFGSTVRLVGPLLDYIAPVKQRVEATLPAAGGTIAIADAASAMNGAALTVPAGALPQESALVLAKAHGALALDADLQPLGPVVDLDLQGARLLKPVRITLPFDRRRLTAGHAVAAFAFVDGGPYWHALPVVAYDPARGLMTVETMRATKYVVAGFAPAPATQTTAFRPSVHGFRIANVPGQTANGADLGAGFVGFSRWYAAAHPGCPALNRLTDTGVQRAIVAAAHAKSRLAALSASATRSALPWADFVASIAREAARGRPPLIAHVPLAPAAALSGLESQASLVWETRSDAGGRLFVYQPSRGPIDSVFVSPADYTKPGSKTYLLPWPELFDDADLRAVFDSYKSNLGCVPPLVSLSANPTSAHTGQTSVLGWTTTHALSCTASGDWSGPRSTSGGSESVALGTTPGVRNYTLTCAGVEGTSTAARVAVTVTAAAPPLPCASIGGRWTETATVDIACDVGGSGSESATGSGTIVQNGCSISYTVMGVARTGRVDGQRLTLSGPAGLAEPGVTLTRNVLTVEGVISADARRIDATGVGEVAGTLDGIFDRCTLQSRSVLTR